MNLFSLRSNCEISPPPDLSLILTAQCLQDICVSDAVVYYGVWKVSKCLSWQGSIFLDAMVKVRGVKQLSVSCVYVVRAKSWWEIGKNDRL